MSVSTEKATALIRAVAQVIEKKKEYLSDLDQQIGDGDHGFNMARGFGAVLTKIDAQPPADIGELFKITAMALISNVGGASGPLYGTFFLKMAAAAQGKTELDLGAFVPVLKAGIAGVQDRGKAVLGEKTMLDVLIPVAEHLETELNAGSGGKASWISTAAFAEKCLEDTKDKIATKGRAAYLGERSRGHIDPGAASSCLMIQTVTELL